MFDNRGLFGFVSMRVKGIRALIMVGRRIDLWRRKPKNPSIGLSSPVAVQTSMASPTARVTLKLHYLVYRCSGMNEARLFQHRFRTRATRIWYNQAQ